MAEKTIDIVAEKLERLEIRRNTSNQIISYTLPEETPMSYGYVKLGGHRTSFVITDYNKVLHSAPYMLVEPIPELELDIIRSSHLALNKFVPPSAPFVDDTELDFEDEDGVEFIDTFSARYMIDTSHNTPPNGNVWGLLNFPNLINNNSAVNHNHAVYQTLKFTKVVYGPTQVTPGRYLITPELIESGRDLKMKYVTSLKNQNITGNVENSVGLHRFRASGNSAHMGESYETTNATTDYKSMTLQSDIVIKNEDMIAYDEWQLQGKSSAPTGQFIRSETSVWEIEVSDEGEVYNTQPTNVVSEAPEITMSAGSSVAASRYNTTSHQSSENRRDDRRDNRRG